MKLWGNDTTIMVKKEMKQLHWCKSFQPVCWIDLTLKQQSTVLESRIFVQKKKTGEVKARMVAGGNRQQGRCQLPHHCHQISSLVLYH